MQAPKTSITTPRDDPIGYSLDWRQRLAQAVISKQGRVPRTLSRDKHLKEYTQVLRAQKSEKESSLSRKYDCIRRWHDNEQIREIIEGMLCTAADYTTIAADLCLDENSLIAYHDIYFDIRGPNGKPKPIVVLAAISNESQENIVGGLALKRAGFTCGYGLLKSLLAPGDISDDLPTEEMLQVTVNAELMRRTLGGDMSTADLIRLSNSHTSYQKMKYDTGSASIGANEGFALAMELLSAMAPTVVAQGNKSDEEKQSANDALKSKLAAKNNISKQPVQDANPEDGKAMLGDLIKKHFEDAPS